MLTLHSFLIYCTLYAITIAVPGPGVVAIVARALGSGFRAAVPAIIGGASGELVIMTLCVLGLALVAQSMGNLFLAVKLAGAAYLVYLGFRYWTAPVSDEASTQNEKTNGFLAQFALTLGNPKAITFFVVLLPASVDLKTLDPVGYLQLCAVTAILNPAITLSYAALASRVREFLTNVSARRRLNKTAAVVLVGAGVGVAVS